MDMDDNVGGLAGAMMSPAAFRIASWGQRVGPFVGPMKSAMGFDADDELGRPAHTRGNGHTYMSNGQRMNSAGYLANPSRSAQIRARNAGALTNREARSMGLTNRRDMDDDVGAAWALAGKLIMHELQGGRPAYDEDEELGSYGAVFGRRKRNRL